MSLAFLIKNLYKPNEIQDMAGIKRPWLDRVPKNKNGGRNQVLNWEFARPDGARTSFTSALAAQDNQSVGKQLMTQPSQKFTIYRLDAKEAAVSMRGDAQAYVATRKHEASRRIDDLYTMIDIDCHGTGSGIFAQNSGAPSGTTVTLTTDSMINRFQLQQRYTNATNNPVDGTAPTLGTWSGVVVGTNFQTREVTFDNVTGLGNADYFLFPGDGVGFSATNFYGSIIGRGAWVPESDPSTSDSFLGMINRGKTSGAVATMSGFRTPAGGLTTQDAVLLNAAAVHEFGGAPDFTWLNPTDWQRMAINLQSQVRYTSVGTGKASFTALELAGVGGQTLKVVPDPHQKRGTARVDTMDTWELSSVGDLVELVDDDGISALRDGGADAFQIRNRSYPQLRCLMPMANGVVTGI